MSTTRREFLSGLMHGALVPVAIGLSASACGDGGSGEPGGDAGVLCSSTGVSISSNHGHTLEVPLADVAAGTEKTYTLTDNGSHEHTVVVTAAQFAQLASGTEVTARSDVFGAHSHGVTITCVQPG